MNDPQPFQVPGYLRWRKTFPWLHLLRAPGIAARWPLLFVGFVGSYLLMMLEILLLGSSFRNQLPTLGRFLSQTDQMILEAVAPNRSLYHWFNQITTFPSGSFFWMATLTVFLHIIFGLTLSRMSGALWSTGNGLPLFQCAGRSLKKLPSVAFAFLFPALLLLLLGGIGAGCLLTERIPQLGPWIAGILYGLALITTFLVLTVSIGLMIGWPLIITSLSQENGDGFDAWSRSFDYLRSRLVSILILASCTLLIGLIIQIVLGELSRLTWERMDATIARITETSSEAVQKRDRAVLAEGPEGFQNMWKTLWTCLIHGYLYSYYWTTITGIYLIIRHSVDRTPFKEFHKDEEERPDSPKEAE